MSDKNKHKVLDKIVLLELKADKLDTEKMKLAKVIASLKTRLKKDSSKILKPIEFKKETCEIIDLEPFEPEDQDPDEMMDPLQFCTVEMEMEEMEVPIKPVVKPLPVISKKSLTLGNFKIPKLDHNLIKYEEKSDDESHLPMLTISTHVEMEMDDVPLKPVVKPLPAISKKRLTLGNFKIPKLDHNLIKNEEKSDDESHLPVLIISKSIFEEENDSSSSTDDPTHADENPSSDAENYPNLTSKEIESIHTQIRLIKNSTNLIFDDKEMANLTNLSLDDKRASIMSNYSKTSVKCSPIPKLVQNQKSKKSKENKQPSLCPTCQRPFADPSNLRRHIRRVHLGEKTICCPHCPEKFFARRDLKKHNFIHEGIKPFKCTFCPKSFRKNTEFMKHLMGHKEAQLFECKICNKVFNQKLSIDNHNKAKHDTNTITSTTATATKTTTATATTKTKTNTTTATKTKVKNAGRYFLI